LPEKAFGKAENSTFIRFPRSWRVFGADFSPLRREGASNVSAAVDCKFGVASERLRQYQYRPSKRTWK
jgi:hypothetical protein